MRFTNKINQRGATGYILLWLLGIPIPILLLIFCEVAIKGKADCALSGRFRRFDETSSRRAKSNEQDKKNTIPRSH
jgi:hypothetical protein